MLRFVFAACGPGRGEAGGGQISIYMICSVKVAELIVWMEIFGGGNSMICVKCLRSVTIRQDEIDWFSLRRGAGRML